MSPDATAKAPSHAPTLVLTEEEATVAGEVLGRLVRAWWRQQPAGVPLVGPRERRTDVVDAARRAEASA